MRENRDYSSKVGYQFTPMPKQLTHLLDGNLRSMLFALIDASEYFADEDGWFYRTNDQLQLDSCHSKNLVVATVETLFKLSLVEVSCIGIGKSRKPNGYRVNTGMFKLFEQLDMNTDIHRPENQITTLKYKGSGYHASYLDDDPERFVPELVKGKINWKSTKNTMVSTPDDTSTSTKEFTTDVTKSEHNKDNIDSIYNKEYIKNIEDIEYKENVNNIDNKSSNSKLLYNNKLEEKLDNGEEKVLLEKVFEEGVTEPNSKNENEGKEDPNEYQFININNTRDNQDSIQGDFQDESGGESSPSPFQSNDDDTRRQEGDASSTNQSPLEEVVTGIKMVGLFDPEPSKDNQKKPMLSVRAATRLWAEELEAKYQTRERTLQNLAMEHPLGFEKYVNYLRTQRRPAFQHHQELIHDLAVTWEIDMDLDLD